MMDDDRFRKTTREERNIFRLIVRYVQEHLEKFGVAGSVLDDLYTTSKIRIRKAKELKASRADMRGNGDTRAMRRRHFDYERFHAALGEPLTPEEAVPPPPRRERDEHGKLLHPESPLIVRFWTAFREVFDPSTALHVLNADQRGELAQRRVLLAWIRIDPDRGSVRRITHFQDIRTEPTDDGLMPILEPIEHDPTCIEETLYVPQDGSIVEDEAEWIELTQESLEEICHDASRLSPPVTGNGQGNPTVPSSQVMSADGLTGKTAEDEVEVAALTGSQRRVLVTLDTFSLEVIATVDMVWRKMPSGHRLGKRSIGPAIKRLVDLGLAERPNGPRGGARLTLKGKWVSKRIAD